VTDNIHKQVISMRSLIGDMCILVVSNEDNWPLSALIKSDEEIVTQIFGFMTKVTNYMEGWFSNELVPERYYRKVIS
jgi:hypothetical protein